MWRSYIIPRPLWKSKPTLLFFLPTDELAPPQITLSHLKRALVNNLKFTGLTQNLGQL